MAQLEAMPWVARNPDTEGPGPAVHTMREYYDLVMVPFGETLTDMERRGIKVGSVELARQPPSRDSLELGDPHRPSSDAASKWAASAAAHSPPPLGQKI